MTGRIAGPRRFRKCHRSRWLRSIRYTESQARTLAAYFGPPTITDNNDGSFTWTFRPREGR